MHIKILQKKAYETAVKCGQCLHIPDWPSCLREIAKELQEVRDAVFYGKMETTVDLFGKPEGLPSELADIVLATLSIAEHFGIDMEVEIDRKQRYNEMRRD